MSAKRSLTICAVSIGSSESASKSGIFANLCFKLKGIYCEYIDNASPPKNTTPWSINVCCIVSYILSEDSLSAILR